MIFNENFQSRFIDTSYANFDVHRQLALADQSICTNIFLLIISIIHPMCIVRIVYTNSLIGDLKIVFLSKLKFSFLFSFLWSYLLLKRLLAVIFGMLPSQCICCCAQQSPKYRHSEISRFRNLAMFFTIYQFWN